MDVISQVATMTCSKCGKEKPLTDFVKQMRMRFGRGSTCQACAHARWKELRVIAETHPQAVSDSALKTCTDCGVEKPMSMFHVSRYGVGRRRGRCKECQRGVSIKKRLEMLKSPEWKQLSRSWHRAAHLRIRYGLKHEDYLAMVEAQGGLCAICGNPETSRKRGSEADIKDLAVDHDHSTGKLRELLCARCNAGLGNFLDEPDRLRAAAEYLERHNAVYSRG